MRQTGPIGILWIHKTSWYGHSNLFGYDRKNLQNETHGRLRPDDQNNKSHALVLLSMIQASQSESLTLGILNHIVVHHLYLADEKGISGVDYFVGRTTPGGKSRWFLMEWSKQWEQQPHEDLPDSTFEVEDEVESEQKICQELEGLGNFLREFWLGV